MTQPQQQMTAEQAIQILDNTIAQLQLDRRNTLITMEAVQVLNQLILKRQTAQFEIDQAKKAEAQAALDAKLKVVNDAFAGVNIPPANGNTP